MIKAVRWGRFVLIWLAIGVAIAVPGFFAAIKYTYRANDHMIPVAVENAEAYWKTGTLSREILSFRASSYVYTADGKLIDSAISEGNAMDFNGRAAAMLETIKAERGQLYRLIFDRKINGRLAVVIAVPRFEHGELLSVFFFVKSLTSLYFNFMILVLAFMLLYVLTIIYSAAIIKKNQALEKLRRDYVANVSHSLKSPISSIMSLSEVLSDGIVQDGEKVKKYGGIILRESRTLEKTVLSMLNLSLMQSGHKDFSKTLIPTDTLFCPIIEKYGAVCAERGITLHVDSDSGAWPLVYTNVECVSELSEALLDNAVKFTPENGNIWLSWTADMKYTTVRIRDDGEGISREDAQHIFERFYRGDSEAHGSGLGLAIAAGIAEGLGERLWVDAQLETGTAFCFTLHFR